MMPSGDFSSLSDHVPLLVTMLFMMAKSTINHRVKLAKFFIMFQNFQSGASRWKIDAYTRVLSNANPAMTKIGQRRRYITLSKRLSICQRLIVSIDDAVVVVSEALPAVPTSACTCSPTPTYPLKNTHEHHTMTSAQRTLFAIFDLNRFIYTYNVLKWYFVCIVVVPKSIFRKDENTKYIDILFCSLLANLSKLYIKWVPNRENHLFLTIFLCFL